ncbi:DinB family protein [Fulvivirga lutea]|uniref:DinB family protein n=1 Tax=Fulvivirga lutea TaxID=2810512 RepID=A0A975A1G5_9BACT|nr:DinB family protein [Fulvivirga lutea]QSE98286.1 DinB family protein [Fulvivirga lutea]
MAQFNKQEFIDSTLKKIADQKAFVKELSQSPIEEITKKASEKEWSALECVDHMNKAMSLYTEQMKELNLESGEEEIVKIGLKGNFFAEGMRPKGEKISYKMPTTKIFVPEKNDATIILENFLKTLDWSENFLLKNRQNKWHKVKVTSALGPLVKFNLAEAFNFLLAHNERHILQARKAMNRM